jgi:glycogen synthase
MDTDREEANTRCIHTSYLPKKRLMRICFISYEYPPDTGLGGIATYVQQIAALMSARKIDTEVICASQVDKGTIRVNDFLSVTKVHCSSTEEFRVLSPLVVAGRHNHKPFDIIEVPEYGAEALHIKEKLPGVPLVVKLHTPKFLLKELNDHYYDRLPMQKIKGLFGRGYKRDKDPEFKAIQFADHILSPSLSLKDIAVQRWDIPAGKIIHAPNPYFPSQALLNIQPGGKGKTVLYIGRLETRKGVYNLSKAVPHVIRQIPGVQFIFLGKDSRGPLRESSMKKVMQKEMGDALSNVTFIDQVPLTDIPQYMAQADVCVFPSLWENFPNVCLEAMSAARGVVASKEGGMKDMLEDINAGVLVDPQDEMNIANGIVGVLNNAEFRVQAGMRGRHKIMEYYSGRLAGELITIYNSFIKQ